MPASPVGPASVGLEFSDSGTSCPLDYRAQGQGRCRTRRHILVFGASGTEISIQRATDGQAGLEQKHPMTPGI